MIIEVVCTANIAIVLKTKNILRKYLQLEDIFFKKRRFYGNIILPKVPTLLNIHLQGDKY